MTIRQAIATYCSPRPHEWYTLDEIVYALRKYEKRKDKDKQERCSYFKIVNSSHKWNNKIVRSRMVVTEDNLVRVNFQGQYDYIHVQFLKPARCDW